MIDERRRWLARPVPGVAALRLHDGGFQQHFVIHGSGMRTQAAGVAHENTASNNALELGLLLYVAGHHVAGDLGRNGMGISEGNITLYTAAAGVDPQQVRQA